MDGDQRISEVRSDKEIFFGSGSVLYTDPGRCLDREGEKTENECTGGEAGGFYVIFFLVKEKTGPEPMSKFWIRILRRYRYVGKRVIYISVGKIMPEWRMSEVEATILLYFVIGVAYKTR